MLDRFVEFRGKLESIRMDNGLEFIGEKLKICCEERSNQLSFIQPGKLVQNAFIKRKNKSIRKEIINFCFLSLNEISMIAEQWRMNCNHERLHSALGFVPPVAYI